MKVIKPTNNPITGQYTATHRAYDFAGLNLPDEVRAGMNGVVVEVQNTYTTNWTNNGSLTVRDYGNYIKIKHDDGTIELHCHLKKDSMFAIGIRVTAGQIIARIGNTGNSTGPHLHSEYRTSQNVNTQVEFVENIDPLQACLIEHAKAVESANKKDSVITELNKKITELLATEKRLIEEKDRAVRELEGKLSTISAVKDRECQEKLAKQKEVISQSIADIIKKATEIQKLQV